jgi:hypothetical protein
VFQTPRIWLRLPGLPPRHGPGPNGLPITVLGQGWDRGENPKSRGPPGPWVFGKPDAKGEVERVWGLMRNWKALPRLGSDGIEGMRVDNLGDAQ